MLPIKRLIYCCLFFWGITFVLSCEIDVKRSDDNESYKNFSSGKWVVEKMEIPGTNYVSEYQGYEIVFFSTGNASAYLSGAVYANGNWLGSKEKFAFDLNFPGAANPLKRLNGTWAIFFSSEAAIRCTRNEGAETFTLWLMKS
jgi:hypothetical protein